MPLWHVAAASHIHFCMTGTVHVVSGCDYAAAWPALYLPSCCLLVGAAQCGGQHLATGRQAAPPRICRAAHAAADCSTGLRRTAAHHAAQSPRTLSWSCAAGWSARRSRSSSSSTAMPASRTTAAHRSVTVNLTPWALFFNQHALTALATCIAVSVAGCNTSPHCTGASSPTGCRQMSNSCRRQHSPVAG